MSYQTKLKDNCWIDAYQLADWLNIKESKLDVSSVKASITFDDLFFEFLEGGTNGNNYQVELVGGATAGAEVVTSTPTLLSIQIEDNISTAQQVKDAFDAFALANPDDVYVAVTISGTAGNAQRVTPASYLLGGKDHDETNEGTVRKMELFCNFACDKIESLISANVLPVTFLEEQDGNSSNVVVPAHWPVQKINYIKIDYNRKFTEPTKLEVENYFLRGVPDKRQKVSDTEVKIVGSDIVLRDDNEKYIIGRIFAGSAVGSIQFEYVAGWCREFTRSINGLGITRVDCPNLPSDLTLAALQLAEWFYYQRENRDLGVTQKGVQGESYTKIEGGIPQQIHQLIEQYVDLSLGTHNHPQRNTWGIDDRL